MRGRFFITFLDENKIKEGIFRFLYGGKNYLNYLDFYFVAEEDPSEA